MLLVEMAGTEGIIHVDPKSGLRLKLDQGRLANDESDVTFPFKDGAWRIVQEASNYADSFGFQWNEFQQTQLDDATRSTQSRTRLWATTAWNPDELRGRKVLEVGSGAGRFTRELLRSTEADIYSVDYSRAVDANHRNNGGASRLHLYQASVYELPFAPRQFDFVLCLGVLQHTPDFRKAVNALAEMVKPGGQLVIDFYCIRGWWTKVSAKYMLRPVTKRIPERFLLNLIRANVPWMVSLSQMNTRLGVGVLNRFIPVVDIGGTLPRSLDRDALLEWATLDTFDMFSPAHDHPQRLGTVARWVQEAGLSDVEALNVTYEQAKAAVVRARRASS